MVAQPSSIDALLFGQLESLYRALRLASQDVLCVGTGNERLYFFQQRADEYFKLRLQRFPEDIHAAYTLHVGMLSHWTELSRASKVPDRQETAKHAGLLCATLGERYISLVDLHQRKEERQTFLHYPYYTPDRSSRSDSVTQQLPGCNFSQTRQGFVNYVAEIEKHILPTFLCERDQNFDTNIILSSEEGYKTFLEHTKKLLEQHGFDLAKPRMGLLPTMHG